MTAALLDGLQARLANPNVLGLPGATDIDFRPIAHLLANGLAINLGNPQIDGVDGRNTHDLEREVCRRLTADVFRGEPDRWFSYIASGTTSAIRHAVMVARDFLPSGRWGRGPVIYASDVAHQCVEKIARNLRLPLEPIPSLHGQMDMHELAARVHAGRPAILVATIGTTMVEGVDDATLGRWVLREMGATDVWVHADAALSGIPLALDPDPPNGARLDRGAVDSLEVSGHKFPGTIETNAWCVIRDDAIDVVGRPVLHYTRTSDITPEGCRSGLNALRWWWVLHTQGIDGLRARTVHARALAADTCAQLVSAGVVARRFPWAFTVAFPAPPPQVVDRWGLATAPIPQNPACRIAHVITMPGIDEGALRACVADLIGEVGR